MHIYIDGEWYSRETAKVSVFDHGLLYGDGVFEGIRVYNRRIFRLEAHLDRLYASALALALTIPLDRAQMTAAVRETVRRNEKEDAYIRLVVTRGAGDLGIDPRKCARASVIIIVTDISVYPRELYASGIKVITSATRQVSHDAFDPRVKSLNYLKNILAKTDANRAGVHEAIMLNADGFIAECTADNFYVVRGGRLLTPSPQDGALEGITRGAILELAAEAGIAANEARLTRYDVYTADECFVSGTGAELMPVTEADGRPIADSKPGPITRKLTEAFQALVRHEGEPIW
ncbi:MAG: branched-chain-amino-acid transaminase [Deltaproteobacteria bacterium]|nr:branched-chain-amino-acid transaminase [Deltaproteobacteria bacterium]MBI3391129.1 branched-chain-amino-acid transaminase [Deltaproteobacteria bacterium]